MQQSLYKQIKGIKTIKFTCLNKVTIHHGLILHTFILSFCAHINIRHPLNRHSILQQKPRKKKYLKVQDKCSEQVPLQISNFNTSLKAAFFCSDINDELHHNKIVTHQSIANECINSYLAIDNFYTFCSCVIHMVPPLIRKLLTRVITYLQRIAIRNICSPSEPRLLVVNQS